MIQVSDSRYPVEFLKHFSLHRDDLEEFTWSFTENFLSSGNSGEKLWISSSDPYFKKKNMSSDQAEWSGWEIHARTSSFEYIITIERRKYIPPIMSNFSDFILITKLPISEPKEEGKEESKRQSNKMIKQEPTIKPEGDTLGGPTEAFKVDLMEHRELIDSIEPANTVS